MKELLLRLLREAMPEIIGGLVVAAVLAVIGALYAVGIIWAAALVAIVGVVLVTGLWVFLSRRQPGVPRSYDEQRAKRQSVLRALLGEIQNNAACGRPVYYILTSEKGIDLRGFARESSDDVWQHARDEIYWLPAEFQEQLHVYYRTLHSLQAVIRERIEDETLKRIELARAWGLFPIMGDMGDIGWLNSVNNRVRSFVQSSEELSEALRKQIGQLEVAEECDPWKESSRIQRQ